MQTFPIACKKIVEQQIGDKFMGQFTIAEHHEHAKKIIKMHNELNEMLHTISRAYGVTSKEVKALLRAKLNLERLRCTLDSAIMGEHTDMPVNELNYYYRSK
jgi:uncharacterized protein YdcH (DUF465 family)